MASVSGNVTAILTCLVVRRDSQTVGVVVDERLRGIGESLRGQGQVGPIRWVEQVEGCRNCLVSAWQKNEINQWEPRPLFTFWINVSQPARTEPREIHCRRRRAQCRIELFSVVPLKRPSRGPSFRRREKRGELSSELPSTPSCLKRTNLSSGISQFRWDHQVLHQIEDGAPFFASAFLVSTNRATNAKFLIHFNALRSAR